MIEETLDQGVIKIGAEAVLRKLCWRGLTIVEKKRLPKPYRHPHLDQEVRSSRTLKEVRVMMRAKEVGVSCPAVLHVDIQEAAIYMQFIEGIELRQLLAAKAPSLGEIAYKLGEALAKLHETDIYHGDFVPSNVIVVGEQPVLVDFGLSGFTSDIEELAIDFHLFERGLAAAHPAITGELMTSFRSGYEGVVGVSRRAEVEARVAEIRSRARYVERSS
ncbi:MAG: Kae1-associated kinase Bud32 [Nitrososphaerota archaeon]